ncbi:MAG: 3-dehydroquinate synthase [Christensenellaceae bacterium]|jgi:3-dehydroquinate synthase|nr:3-dehydroquinate synthase [Christensenellaceae bacterium]
MKEIVVSTLSKSYQVKLGESILGDIGDAIKGVISPQKIAIITDANVQCHYGQSVKQSLEKAGFSPIVHVITPGEGSKTLRVVEEILKKLAQLEFARSDAIVALGGGVVGDIAGFVASIYKRGIEFIQIPSSLLAIIDSSIGGKTGVNLDEGKNFVGAFYQPSLVYADMRTLDTLPEREVTNGLGEMIKYAILSNSNLYEMLKKGNALTLGAIEICINYKADIVSKDERESKLRKLLNLGHTFAHAIEKLSKYNIAHGYAVAMGIALISNACYRNSILAKESCDKILDLLLQYNLPIESNYHIDDLIEAARGDKKNDGKKISFIGIREIGDCDIFELDPGEFRRFMLC